MIIELASSGNKKFVKPDGGGRSYDGSKGVVFSAKLGRHLQLGY